MQIIKYKSQFTLQIMECFYKSIQAISEDVYNHDERNAWINQADLTLAFWENRLNITQPYLAIIEKKVAGFIELEANGHIDCLYVHPNYQRQKVAQNLYRHIEKIA